MTNVIKKAKGVWNDDIDDDLYLRVSRQEKQLSALKAE